MKVILKQRDHVLVRNPHWS